VASAFSTAADVSNETNLNAVNNYCIFRAKLVLNARRSDDSL
jgi:hypothetical protein